MEKKPRQKQPIGLTGIKEKYSDFGLKFFDFKALGNICKKEEIEVWLMDIPCDGIFALTPISKYIILSDKLDKFGQEYSLAHELGHYFLGHFKDIYYYKEINISRAEFEANLIALMFLLPDQHVPIDVTRWHTFLGGYDNFFYDLGNDILRDLKQTVIDYKRALSKQFKDPRRKNDYDDSIKNIIDRKRYVKAIIDAKFFLSEISHFPRFD